MRHWIIIALVGFLSAAASAETGEWTYRVAKDNFWDKVNPTANNSTKPMFRAGKGSHQGWYGDWSATQKEEIKKKIESLGADEAYTLTFRAATVDNPEEMHGKAEFTPLVAAFSSAEDWVDSEADYTNAAKDKPWMNPDEKKAVDFGKLPRVANSKPVVGNWDKATEPDGNISWNSAVLDKAVVEALISNPNCRGLVMYSDPNDELYNDYTFSKKKWGGKVAPRLVLKIEKKPVAATTQPAK